MSGVDPDDLDIKFADEETGVAWGVELEFADQKQPSVFYSARKVVLDGEFAQIQLPDGTYASYPIGQVRKILSMKADPPPGYTEDDDIADLSDDELY